ncbi:MAG: hypothetical protein OEX21_11220 [Betaproteobacteria bacterium]|nr:hypothetical protein [Betaproteobacteria bacterium]
MNKPDDALALRKELLLARSSLCRLKIRHEADILRHSLSWRGAATAVAAAPPARAALFLLAAEAAGHARMARWLTLAGRALAAVRLARLALHLLRRPA